MLEYGHERSRQTDRQGEEEKSKRQEREDEEKTQKPVLNEDVHVKA